MQWFKNCKTLTKLMLTFCLMSMLMAFVAYQGISGANTINNMLNDSYDHNLLGISSIKEANTYVVKIGREARSIILETRDAEASADTSATLRPRSAIICNDWPSSRNAFPTISLRPLSRSCRP